MVIVLHNRRGGGPARQVVDRVTAAQERLDFGEAGRAVYDFFWSQFADWYIEAAKTRLYGGDAAAAQTTRAVRRT